MSRQAQTRRAWLSIFFMTRATPPSRVSGTLCGSISPLFSIARMFSALLAVFVLQHNPSQLLPVCMHLPKRL